MKKRREKITVFLLTGALFLLLTGCEKNVSGQENPAETDDGKAQVETIDISSARAEETFAAETEAMKQERESSGYFRTDAGAPLNTEKSAMEEEAGNDLYAPYDEFVSLVTEGLRNGFTEDAETLDISSCFYYTNPSFEIIGYMRMDLDGDGIDELLFGENSPDGGAPPESWDSIIYGIYTLQDGKMRHVVDGWERNRFYLCEDGLLANEGSSGAAYSSWTYYRFAHGEAQVVGSVFTDEVNLTPVYCRSDGEPYGNDAIEITEAELRETVESHVYQKLSFTPFL